LLKYEIPWNDENMYWAEGNYALCPSFIIVKANKSTTVRAEDKVKINI
jgi:hypothetical protein